MNGKTFASFVDVNEKTIAALTTQCNALKQRAEKAERERDAAQAVVDAARKMKAAYEAYHSHHTGDYKKSIELSTVYTDAEKELYDALAASDAARKGEE